MFDGLLPYALYAIFCRLRLGSTISGIPNEHFNKGIFKKRAYSFFKDGKRTRNSHGTTDVHEQRYQHRPDDGKSHYELSVQSDTRRVGASINTSHLGHFARPTLPLRAPSRVLFLNFRLNPMNYLCV
ncbi:hypothetical protein EVAR_81191_1 [Eumeta japonica]|uniref:Uncharacterized protein n=1 Tax=Eumeta variegata TaxID=151549 RepID=A0A4C1UK70_EUMVA|nr:hypothetical protein EVAR_81191_1 [Eumeta japonica]